MFQNHLKTYLYAFCLRLQAPENLFKHKVYSSRVWGHECKTVRAYSIRPDFTILGRLLTVYYLFRNNSTQPVLLSETKCLLKLWVLPIYAIKHYRTNKTSSSNNRIYNKYLFSYSNKQIKFVILILFWLKYSQNIDTSE